MIDVNKELYKIYSKYWGRIEDGLRDIDTVKEKVSYPLLINVFPEYLKSNIKILFIGQQTYGWGFDGGKDYFGSFNSGDIINELMNLYKGFHLGENYTKSPFWLAANYVYKQLNPDCPDYGYLYSNIVKVDQDGYRPDSTIEKIVFDTFPVVPLEVQVLKPDVVIFFTGPDYEERLRQAFPGLIVESVDQYPNRLLARVKHPVLPQNTFRTYHPNYLKRSGNYSMVLDKILSLVKG